MALSALRRSRPCGIGRPRVQERMETFADARRAAHRGGGPAVPRTREVPWSMVKATAALTAGAAVVAALVVLGYFALHNRTEAQHAHAELVALKQSVAAEAQASKATHLPVPSTHTVTEYHSPYNVRVVCDVTGSVRGANGVRLPLNLNVAPKPGDLYVKTCRGFALTSAR
jgi:hypothetical protein